MLCSPTSPRLVCTRLAEILGDSQIRALSCSCSRAQSCCSAGWLVTACKKCHRLCTAHCAQSCSAGWSGRGSRQRSASTPGTRTAASQRTVSTDCSRTVFLPVGVVGPSQSAAAPARSHKAPKKAGLMLGMLCRREGPGRDPLFEAQAQKLKSHENGLG